MPQRCDPDLKKLKILQNLFIIKLILNLSPHHREFSQLIWTANQLTGFYYDNCTGFKTKFKANFIFQAILKSFKKYRGSYYIFLEKGREEGVEGVCEPK